ncbi:MAG TPA: hypothetical protein VHZ28_04560 [Terracidiphilus sp.]|jgi:hypothetical protein|nr:hypothetical protein [Terracidiphilus sp.]
MYSRTQNEDGSLTSRCLYCFAAIASEVAKWDVERMEASHICPEKALAQQLALEQTSLIRPRQ